MDIFFRFSETWHLNSSKCIKSTWCDKLPLRFLFCFYAVEERLVTHTTDVHIWNNNSNTLFSNVLIQPRTACLLWSCLHTLSSSWEIAGLAFLHICYHLSLNRMKNNFHGTRLYIYHSGHEVKVPVVFSRVLSVHHYVVVFFTWHPGEVTEHVVLTYLMLS